MRFVIINKKMPMSIPYIVNKAFGLSNEGKVGCSGEI